MWIYKCAQIISNERCRMVSGIVKCNRNMFILIMIICAPMFANYCYFIVLMIIIQQHKKFPSIKNLMKLLGCFLNKILIAWYDRKFFSFLYCDDEICRQTWCTLLSFYHKNEKPNRWEMIRLSGGYIFLNKKNICDIICYYCIKSSVARY